LMHFGIERGTVSSTARDGWIKVAESGSGFLHVTGSNRQSVTHLCTIVGKDSFPRYSAFSKIFSLTVSVWEG
jgi:hypothetical protein